MDNTQFSEQEGLKPCSWASFLLALIFLVGFALLLGSVAFTAVLHGWIPGVH